MCFQLIAVLVGESTLHVIHQLLLKVCRNNVQLLFVYDNRVSELQAICQFASL